MGIDGAGVDDVVVLPHVLEELFAGLNAAATFHEGGEEFEFGGGQVDALAADGDEVARDIDGEVTGLEAFGAFGGLGAAFEEFADAEDEFAGAERLGDVIVGAEFETQNAVDFGGPGGEHDDGDAGGGGVAAEELADFQAVHLGEHDVEEDEIGGIEAGGLEGFGAVGGGDHLEAGTFQIEGDQFDGIGLVVHDQDLWHDAARGYHRVGGWGNGRGVTRGLRTGDAGGALHGGGEAAHWRGA